MSGAQSGSTTLGDHGSKAIGSVIRIGTLDLSCRDGGGSGVPFVFQHGLCGDAEQTFQVAPDGPAIRPITLECRGHGASPPGDLADVSIAAFADDVAALIGLHIGRPVVLGGISMGAAVALQLAVRRPDLVTGLVLGRPAWITEAGPTNMAPDAEVGRLLQQHDPATARALFASGPTARRLATEAPANLASLMTFFDRAPAAVTAALLTRISADSPSGTAAEIARIGVPTLVVGNDHDSVHPLEHAEALAGLIPGARLVIIPSKAADRIGHVVEFRAALTRFFLESLHA